MARKVVRVYLAPARNIKPWQRVLLLALAPAVAGGIFAWTLTQDHGGAKPFMFPMLLPLMMTPAIMTAARTYGEADERGWYVRGRRRGLYGPTYVDWGLVERGELAIRDERVWLSLYTADGKSGNWPIENNVGAILLAGHLERHCPAVTLRVEPENKR